MSLYTKLSSVLHRQKVLSDIRAGSPTRPSAHSATESSVASDESGSSRPSTSPTPINNGRSSRISAKLGTGTPGKGGADSVPLPQAKVQPLTLPSGRKSPSRRKLPKTSKLSQTQTNPSADDFTNAKELKKRNKKEKSCSPLSPMQNLAPCLKVGKVETKDKSTAFQSQSEPTGYTSNYLAQKATAARTSKVASSIPRPKPPSSPPTLEGTENEGPVDLSNESFDLLKILSRPQTWMDENESKNNMIMNSRAFQEAEQAHRIASFQMGNKYQLTVRPKTTPSILTKMYKPESESSETPSLTSVMGQGSQANKEDEYKYILTTDENNNTVLESIKNTIIRSLSFLDVNATNSRTGGDGVQNNNINASVSISSTVRDKRDDVEESSVYTGNDLDEINCIPPEQISSSVSNMYDSASPVASGTFGIFLRSQDSVLIPLEIEEQLQKAFKLNKTSGMQNGQQEMDAKDSDSSAHQLVYDDTATSSYSCISDGKESLTSKEASTVPSYMSALMSDGDKGTDNDEDEVEKELQKDQSLDDNANLDQAEKYNEPKRTSKSRTRLVFHEHTGDSGESRLKPKGGKTEKLKSVVVAGVDIASVQATDSDIATGEPEIGKEDNGIPEYVNPSPVDSYADTPLRAGSLPSFHHHHKLNHEDAAVHPRQLPPLQRRIIDYPRTHAPLGADSGFPSNTAISSFIGNLVQMKWSSPFSCDGEDYVDICNNPTHPGFATQGDHGEGIGLIATAYDILNAGLKYASKIIGDETDLEPQEDFVRYNGYQVKVHGKELLLESVHVNRDFQINSKNGTCCRSIHSFISLQPHTLSRELLEQQSFMGENAKERRVRIVVRITGSSSHVEQAKSLDGLGHSVQFADGKWTFILNQTYSTHGDNVHYFQKCERTVEQDQNSKKNYIEIGCPTGVHAGMIEYAVLNGLLYIDAP